MENINVSTPNDDLGTPLRDAFIIVNDNFQELLALVNLSNETIAISGVTGLQTILNQIQSDLNTVENDLASFESSTNTSIGSLQTSVTTLNTTVSGHTTDINTLQNNVNSINSTLTNINNTITEILSDLQGLTTPTLQEVTDMGNVTTSGITANGGLTVINAYGNNAYGIPYPGGSTYFRFEANGDGDVFPLGRLMLINANVEEQLNINAIYESGAGSTLQVNGDQIFLGHDGVGSGDTINVTVDNSGLGLQTNQISFGYIKADNILTPQTYQLPSTGGTLALLSDITSGTPSELEKITEGGNTGWRLLGRDPAKYGTIGDGAIDFSKTYSPNNVFGATGDLSMVIGEDSTASGYSSFASGGESVASGDYSHAEGYFTQANGDFSHAEGYFTQANGKYSHAEGGQNIASGWYSHVGGFGNTANTYIETVIGTFSEIITGNTTSFNSVNPIFRVGIGPNFGDRKDGFRIYKNGAMYMFPTTTAAITNGANGLFFYNNTTKKLASHDGTSWKDYAHIGTVAPASASDTGIVGEIRITSTFIYTCIAPNTWVRGAMATW